MDYSDRSKLELENGMLENKERKSSQMELQVWKQNKSGATSIIIMSYRQRLITKIRPLSSGVFPITVRYFSNAEKLPDLLVNYRRCTMYGCTHQFPANLRKVSPTTTFPLQKKHPIGRWIIERVQCMDAHISSLRSSAKVLRTLRINFSSSWVLPTETNLYSRGTNDRSDNAIFGVSFRLTSASK